MRKSLRKPTTVVASAHPISLKVEFFATTMSGPENDNCQKIAVPVRPVFVMVAVFSFVVTCGTS